MVGGTNDGCLLMQSFGTFNTPDKVCALPVVGLSLGLGSATVTVCFSVSGSLCNLIFSCFSFGTALGTGLAAVC